MNGGRTCTRPMSGLARALVTLLALLTLAALHGCSPRGEDGTHADAETHEDHEEHGESGKSGASQVVELPPEAIGNAGIRTGVAGPAEIGVVFEAPGEVHLDAERVLEIRPRFGGVVHEIRKRIGDPVRRGELVATVQSNESLADYEITSSMAGTVIARQVVTGQSVDPGTVLLTVADLSSVWVDFAIYPQYVGRIRTGMPVTIVAHNRPELTATRTIHYVGPLLEQDTRVSSARVLLANPGLQWQPGLFVTARVVLEQARVAVAVAEDAIVRTSGGPAVFRADGPRFELHPVATGRSDGRTTEITSGLAAGDSIVVAGAFILKSELAKGEVEHVH